MLDRVRRRLSHYRQVGARRQLRIWRDKALLRLLRLRFRFDPWHADSPTSARPYRRALAARVSALNPRTVVEVGCGLGAILARVKAPERVGYDMDTHVVAAARFLHRGVDFRMGGLADVDEPRIDVLIAVNWTHDFAPEEIERWLAPLIPRTRYLLLDAIERTNPLPYAHHHDFAFLDGLARHVWSDRFGEDHRQFLLYKVSR